MRLSLSPRAGLAALATLFLVPSAASHSWIEAAFKVDPSTLQYYGQAGYPRGGNFRRLSSGANMGSPDYTTDPLYTWMMPQSGTYTGKEILNRNSTEVKTWANETLEAAAGDYVAFLHTENGHVSQIGAVPGKPLNAGTIYLYGTAEPKDEEKLFDIHLVWNKEGTGGDGRGRLLGTRNFDDGRCFEGNSQEVAQKRAGALGIPANVQLVCQSTIKLPEDLKAGTTYTVYWYWDWPTLNEDKIDMSKTAEGLFPWAGTFMRGEKDPNGFKADVIATSQSYSSTIDIKIVDQSEALSAKEITAAGFDNVEKVYTEVIKDQLKNNFQVKVGPSQDEGDGDSDKPSSSSQTQEPASSTGTPQGAATTVTVISTVIAQPTAQTSGDITVTVTKTLEPSDSASKPTSCKARTTTKTVVENKTLYKTVTDTPGTESSRTTSSISPTPTPLSGTGERPNSLFLSTGGTTLTTSIKTSSELPSDITSQYAKATETGSMRRARRVRRGNWYFGLG